MSARPTPEAPQGVAADAEPAAFPAWLSEAELTATPHLEDLRLVFRCLDKDPGSWQRLEALLQAQRGAIASFGNAAFVEDVLANTLASLAQPSGATPMRLARYRGTGPLAAWLRAVLLREAINAQRRAGPPSDELQAHVLASHAADPMLALLKQDSLTLVRQALSSALADLTPRQRTLLRWRFIDNLALADLAALMNVHRTTVARLLAEAAQAVRAGMQAALLTSAKLQPSELDSLLRSLDDNLSGSLGSLLKHNLQ